MPRLEVPTDYLLDTLRNLIETPSPTGDTDWAVSFVQNELESLGVETHVTLKGSLIAELPGLRDDAPRAITAHIDTLGAVVAEIKANGALRLSALGGVNWATVDSEAVNVQTRSGQKVRGAIVLVNGAAHVNKEASTTKRTADSLEVRLDERTSSAEETRQLGVDVGDFVSFDPRFEATEGGFVRSRFLDDKASAACVLAAIKSMRDTGVTPAQRTQVLFSVFEEVGHGGMDGLSPDLHDLLVIDMAVVGQGQNGDAYHCSVCVKDSSGPYHRGLTERVRTIAEQAGIDIKPDVYPYYGSDGSAYWRSGGRARVALVGPGVESSHGYERTHKDALHDTTALISEFLLEE